MWFTRRVDSADHTESHGEISEEIPEEELTHEIDNDSGDFPNSASETDEISTESESQPCMMALMKIVTWFRDNKEAIVLFTVGIFLAYLPSLPRQSMMSLINQVQISGISLCPNDTPANILVQAERINGSDRILCIVETPYHTTEQPAIAMAMTCKHKECERKGSGYRMPTSGKCIRRVCKCGYSTTEFQPTEACNDLYDSCAAQLTLSYGFDCDVGVLKYGYNLTASQSVDGKKRLLHEETQNNQPTNQSAETMNNICDSCAALLTLSFGFDCDDGVSKYGYNTAGFQSAETTNKLCDPCGTRFIQPFGIKCDDEVFSGEVEALVAEAGGGVSVRVSTTVVVESKGGTEKNASEKYDDNVGGS